MRLRAMSRRVPFLLVLGLHSCLALADDPSVGATASGQVVADALREFTNADVALVPAGVLKGVEKGDEASAALAFEGDGVVTVNISGAKLREALERSISAYPQSSVGFLQVSGLEATFKKGAPANARLVSVTVGGARLDDSRTYAVAMPRSLQEGQLGYANLWENIKPLPFEKATLATVVKGRRIGAFVARWSSQA